MSDVPVTWHHGLVARVWGEIIQDPSKEIDFFDTVIAQSGQPVLDAGCGAGRLVPLTLGFGLLLLMWSLSPAIEVSAAVLGGTAAIYAASLLYLAAFLALSLWLSLYAVNSAQALVFLLLAWVLVVVVVPEGGGYLAQAAWPWRSQARYVEQLQTAEARFFDRHASQIGNMQAPWFNSSMSSNGGQQLLATTQGEMERLVGVYRDAVSAQVRFAEERYRLASQYEQDLAHWVRLQRRAELPSLTAQYQQAVQILAATDAGSYARVLAQMRRYREQLLAYLRPYAATSRWFTRMADYPELVATPQRQAEWRRLGEKEGFNAVMRVLSWDRVEPLDLGAMPRLRMTCPSLARGAVRTAPLVLLTVGCAAGFLALAACPGRTAARWRA